MFGLIDIGEYHKWKKRRADKQLKPEFLSSLRVLVVGGGSVGRRYLAILLGLGVGKVAVVEPREDRRAELAEHFGSIGIYAAEDEAYASGPYDIVIVANPPAFHVESGTRAVAVGAHVLMEKSISDKIADVDEFLRSAEKAGRLVGVCYVYRFFDTLQYIKKFLDEGRLGKIYSAQITFSEYLPGWHPWEKPAEWYASQKALGGSELLDENHTIDFATWFFGSITSVAGHVARAADVTVDSDDFAEFTCFHSSGVVSQIHQDAFGRKPRKDMWIMGEKGTFFWDSYMGGNLVEWYDGETGKVEIFKGRVSRPDAFVELVLDFLRAVAENRPPQVGGHEALRTLEVCAAAVRSSAEGKRINL